MARPPKLVLLANRLVGEGMFISCQRGNIVAATTYHNVKTCYASQCLKTYTVVGPLTIFCFCLNVRSNNVCFLLYFYQRFPNHLERISTVRNKTKKVLLTAGLGERREAKERW